MHILAIFAFIIYIIAYVVCIIFIATKVIPNLFNRLFDYTEFEEREEPKSPKYTEEMLDTVTSQLVPDDSDSLPTMPDSEKMPSSPL